MSIVAAQLIRIIHCKVTIFLSIPEVQNERSDRLAFIRCVCMPEDMSSLNHDLLSPL